MSTSVPCGLPRKVLYGDYRQHMTWSHMYANKGIEIVSALKDYDVGVIVGRFQIAELTEGHAMLVREVMRRHKRCVVCVGVSPTLGTRENPLDFPTRKLMIEKEFPQAIVVPVTDRADDKLWSKLLDDMVGAMFPIGKVCLYGGRDSFLKHYTGSYDTFEFPVQDYKPATEVRKDIGKDALVGLEFRKGVIYSTQNQYPRVHMTVDIAIRYYDKVLLGRKHGETKWRFPGGFVGQGETLENSAIREAKEETGIDLTSVNYIGSLPVNDWRYRNTSDKILTAFFVGSFIGDIGSAFAGDDIEEIMWADIAGALDVVDSHKELFAMLQKYVKEKGVDA